MSSPVRKQRRRRKGRKSTCRGGTSGRRAGARGREKRKRRRKKKKGGRRRRRRRSSRGWRERCAQRRRRQDGRRRRKLARMTVQEVHQLDRIVDRRSRLDHHRLEPLPRGSPHHAILQHVEFHKPRKGHQVVGQLDNGRLGEQTARLGTNGTEELTQHAQLAFAFGAQGRCVGGVPQFLENRLAGKSVLDPVQEPFHVSPWTGGRRRRS